MSSYKEFKADVVWLLGALVIGVIITFFLKIILFGIFLTILGIWILFSRLINGKDAKKEDEAIDGAALATRIAVVLVVFYFTYQLINSISNVGSTEQVRSDAEVEQMMAERQRVIDSYK